MGELTEHTPKPLLSVAGKPLIRHHIEKLVSAGITDLVINTSYFGEQIRDYVGNGQDFGARIHCTEESERLETGGGILQALPFLGDSHFLVVNSDVWSNFDYSCLLSSSKCDQDSKRARAHLVLVPNPEHHPKGDFGLDPDSGLVASQAQQRYTFSGISVLSKDLFNGCQPGRFALAPLLREAMVDNAVTGEFFAGFWMDVGTPQRLQQVEEYIQEHE